jgi:hypothetical protein
MSRDILTKFRTKVIEDFIMIEGYVNTIISKHYLGVVSKKFFWEVLQDELFNFGLRSNILEKVFNDISSVEKPKDLIGDLRRLSKIRNYFAHSNTSYFEGPPEARKGGVPHPKKSGEFLDFGVLYKEFEEKVQRVSEQLIQIMDKMGILFKYDTDKKNMTIIFEENLNKCGGSSDNSSTGG